MGLFDKFKKKAEPADELPVEKVTYRNFVNLTAKNVKIAIDDETYVEKVYLWEDDKTIKGMQGENVIFEVTSRSKAYGELKPFARRKLKHITLYKRQGDYGDYYRMGFAIELDREEAFGE